MSKLYYLQKARERVRARKMRGLKQAVWYAAHTLTSLLFVIAFVRI